MHISTCNVFYIQLVSSGDFESQLRLYSFSFWTILSKNDLKDDVLIKLIIEGLFSFEKVYIIFSKRSLFKSL